MGGGADDAEVDRCSDLGDAGTTDSGTGAEGDGDASDVDDGADDG